MERKKLKTISEEEIVVYSSQLLQFLNSIDWYKEGIVKEDISNTNPFKPVFEIIIKIKKDFDNLFNDIKKSQIKFRNLVDNSPDFIAEVDNKMNILSMNLPMANFLGRDIVSLIGKNILGIFTDKIFNARYSLVKKALEKNITITNEDERNGLYFENIYVPSTDHQTVQIIVRDISDRKKAEKEKKDIELKMLAQSKLATLGEVATGVAHEINQPLTYINSVIQLLLEDMDSNELNFDIAKKRLEKSEQQIERITDIINHLRTLGRRKIDMNQEVDLSKVLYDSLLIVNERIRLKNIELICENEKNLLYINGSPNQLEQIFLNMFSNAIDVLEDKEGYKEIKVVIKNIENRSKVLLQISDNGNGMPEEVKNKIFEPFFTTKDVGSGTGLGLSIILGIIEEHGGEIICESEIGNGTVFFIKFPVKAEGKKE